MNTNKRDDSDEAALSEELRKALGGPASARSEFKEAVRERFLGRSLAAKTDQEIGSPGSSEFRSAPDSMIEDVLNNLPAMPSPNPEFRAAMKVAFLEGQVEGAALEEAQIAEKNTGSVVRARRRESIQKGNAGGNRTPAIERAPRRSRTTESPLSTSGFSWQVVTGIAAMAAAILLLVLFPKEKEQEAQRQKLQGWTVAATGAELEIDRVKFAVGRASSLESAINGASSLASLDSSLKLSLKDRVRLGMEPGSQLDLTGAVLPKFAPEGHEGEAPLSDELYFKLEAGELHLMTSRSNPDQVIIVETPHAKVRIVGSVLSIEVFEGEGTCICVKDGAATVEILSGSSDGVRVGDDSTCFIFASDAAPKLGPSSKIVSVEHLEPLLAFYDAEF